MSNRATTLKKQALERWRSVPPARQKELIEELKAWPRGSAVIEVGEPVPGWENGLPTGKTVAKALVIPIAFGVNTDLGTKKRYLALSDIPQPEENEQGPG